jgi:uncharacterized OsmC-like protein
LFRRPSAGSVGSLCPGNLPDGRRGHGDRDRAHRGHRDGEMDLAGTLGVSEDVPVGFETIRTSFDIVAPEATEEQLENLRQKTEQYCVVFQTLAETPDLQTEWA